jgi:hypothetical protein
MITDKQRLDALQALLGEHCKTVLCRWSSTGRGWRLYESEQPGCVRDVRRAIDDFIKKRLDVDEYRKLKGIIDE